jgi:hypothetical protein
MSGIVHPMIHNPDRSGGPPHLPLPVLVLFVIPTAARSAQRKNPRICRCLFTLVILSERSESKNPRIGSCRCLFTLVILFLFVILTLSVVEGEESPHYSCVACLRSSS